MFIFVKDLDRIDLSGLDKLLIVDEVCHAEDCVALESLVFVLT